MRLHFAYIALISMSAAAQTASPETRGPVPLDTPLIYKVDALSQDLTITDLDADGRSDIVAVNNAEGTVDLFYGMTADEASAAPPDPESGMPLERLHDKAELITGRQVDQIAVGDLDGDGLPDVAAGSDRGGGAVFFQSAPRTFETARRLREGARFVAVADWDGDGKADLLATATRDRPALLARITSGADRNLSAVWNVPLASAPSDPPRLIDWDRDGDLDFLWFSAEESKVHVLANDGAGGVGGETVIDAGSAIDWAPVALAARTGLLTLESASGIARLLAPGETATSNSPFSFGSAQRVALAETDSADQVALVAGDLGAERQAVYLPVRGGAEGLLVTASASREVHRSSPPSLHEVDSAQRLDDGRLLLLSRAESTVAIAGPPGSTAVPPQPLPVRLRPLAAALGEFDGEAGLDLLVVGRDAENALITRVIGAALGEEPGSEHDATLAALPSDDPSSIQVADINGDGADDLILFYQYRAPAAHLASGRGEWTPLEAAYHVPPAFFEGVGPSQLWVGDLQTDGTPEVLVARAGLVRVLSFASSPDLQVLGQITIDRAGAQIAAVTAAPPQGSRPAMIFALDRASGVVTIGTPIGGGEWQVAGEVDSDIDSPQRLASGDWDGDGDLDLAVKGSGAVALLFGGLTHPPLEQLATLSSPLEEGRFGRLDCLEWRGGQSLAHLVDHRHHVLFAERWIEAEGSWQEAWRFPVFETPNERRSDWDEDLAAIDVEPREMAAGDIDGDGQDDLVLLCQDHLLIYRGEP